MSEYQYLQFPADAVQVNPVLYAGLPDSARRVFDAVRASGPLTHEQLRLATGLPPRTIRFALKRLREQGCVTSLSSLRDCRARYYFIARSCIRPDALEAARLRAEDAIRQGRLIERVGRHRPPPPPPAPAPQVPWATRAPPAPPANHLPSSFAPSSFATNLPSTGLPPHLTGGVPTRPLPSLDPGTAPASHPGLPSLGNEPAAPLRHSTPPALRTLAAQDADETAADQP